MRAIGIICKRELSHYFTTPLAAVFLIIFLVLSGALTFYLGGLYERNQADLQPFFQFHPWLYLFLVPAISMRLWAEERRAGTMELLLTLPISVTDTVIGKFLAAWIFVGLALVLTFPMWITVNYLGNPDNGVILSSYLSSWLMAGGYLAMGACVSAITKSQVIAFVISLVICFVFMLSGFPMVLGFFQVWAPQWILDSVSAMSVLTHFKAINQGVIDLRDIVYFISLIAIWLYANTLIIELKKAD